MVYWIWLSGIRGLGSVTARRLLDMFSDPEDIYHASEMELMEVPGIGEKLAACIVSSRSLRVAEGILDKMAKTDTRLLTIKDTAYPVSLRSLPKFPVVLYYRGMLPNQQQGVAIVGSRCCTDYGRKVTATAAEYLAQNQIPVISGMAQGIGGYAHAACIKSKGYTQAFLVHGVDICQPKEHRELMHAIITHGAVISEYPPGTPVRRSHFLRRNYIMSSWATKLLVVEAGAQCVSLSTAQLAKDQGKEVLAVPSSIFSREGLGTNRLIANGATMYLEPAQLLPFSDTNVDALTLQESTKLPDLKNRKAIHDRPAYTPSENAIVRALASSSLSVEELAQSLGKDKKGFLETLSVMELEGKIRVLPGGVVEVL